MTYYRSYNDSLRLIRFIRKTISRILPKKIDNLRKLYRRHRDMSRTETAFIESVWRESIGIETKKKEERIQEEGDNDNEFELEEGGDLDIKRI
mmetsp:Transcript_54317/g.61725  ORF Transcript_54317/g.61725 Transcript_54317/m.61725 type:complete len:93 (+) Transcript_54317:778-1056(+)